MSRCWLFLRCYRSGLALSSCSPGGDTGKAQTINFGSNLSGSCALVYIAQERGIFADQGLIVNNTDYDTGAAAIDAVLNGEMNIAWSSEFRLVRGAFAKEKVSAIAVINRFTDQFILGRSDSGINGIADLKGKKIGVPKNTIAEFYLTRFLTLNGISMDEYFPR